MKAKCLIALMVLLTGNAIAVAGVEACLRGEPVCRCPPPSDYLRA